MPDAAGNIKGIATTGKAGETLERIFGKREPRSFEAEWREEKEDLPDIDMDAEFFEAQLRGRCIGCFSTDYPTCKGCGADLSAEPRPNG